MENIFNKTAPLDKTYPIHRQVMKDSPFMNRVTVINTDTTLYSYVNNVCITAQANLDNAVLQKIFEIANREGYDEAIVIDKDFVIEALEREVERRLKEKEYEKTK